MFNDFVESKYDYLAVLNKDEKKYFKSINTIVIPNSYTDYSSIKSSLKNKTAISAGRIAPVKQFDKLILTWEIVIQNNPDWILEIYGDGENEEKKELQNLINKKNLNNNIKLCGKTNQLDSAMLKSSLFVMTSQTECFPMVLLEAMSCGLPIVSFDCPTGPKNIITDVIDGYLVKHNDIFELANSISNLINNPVKMRNFGEKGRENVKSYSKENVMNLWINTFTKLKK